MQFPRTLPRHRILQIQVKREAICRAAERGSVRMKSSKQDFASFPAPKARFINPHRLFHGVWLPQWLEERAEVSEKAKKLYAYLTYFAGGRAMLGRPSSFWRDKLHYLAPLCDQACSGAFRAPAYYRHKRRQSQRKAIARTITAFFGILGCRPSDDGHFRLAVPRNNRRLFGNRGDRMQPLVTLDH